MWASAQRADMTNSCIETRNAANEVLLQFSDWWQKWQHMSVGANMFRCIGHLTYFDVRDIFWPKVGSHTNCHTNIPPKGTSWFLTIIPSPFPFPLVQMTRTFTFVWVRSKHMFHHLLTELFYSINLLCLPS